MIAARLGGARGVLRRAVLRQQSSFASLQQFSRNAKLECVRTQHICRARPAIRDDSPNAAHQRRREAVTTRNWCKRAVTTRC